MTDKILPATEPDMIEQVGKMLKRINVGEYCTPGLDEAVDRLDLELHAAVSTDATIVIASAILAVAAELRSIDNTITVFGEMWRSRQ
jgi:hypothetical protein